MKKIMRCISLMIMLAAVLSHPLLAAGAVNVLQVQVTGQGLTIFTDTAMATERLTCKVSNQLAEVLTSGSMSDVDTSVKTTILVDISTSIPSSMRAKVLDALSRLIEQKAPNEAFKVVTFGDEITTLCDFSSDRYDISSASNGILFNGRASRIYDAIYTTMPSVDRTLGTPTLYRTVVITDGVDKSDVGVTMEELFLKLQLDHYPVDIVAVSDKDSGENKELSAIARISNGRYCALGPGTDLNELREQLDVSECCYVEVKAPEHLLDGTVRQVDLNDGTVDLSIDVKFPAIYEPSSSVEPTAEPSSEPENQPEPSVTPTVESPSVDEPMEKELDMMQMILIAVGAVAVIGAAVLVIVLVRKNKQKREKAGEPAGLSPRAPGTSDKRTVFIGSDDDSDAKYTIKLTAPKHPGKEWTIPVAGDVLIGRADYCIVQLDDPTVSREQCKLTVENDEVVVLHLGSTNRTRLNGSSLTGSTPVHSGDILKFGHELLQIEYIQTLDGIVSAGNSSEKASDGSRGTRSLF